MKHQNIYSKLCVVKDIERLKALAAPNLRIVIQPVNGRYYTISVLPSNPLLLLNLDLHDSSYEDFVQAFESIKAALPVHVLANKTSCEEHGCSLPTFPKSQESYFEGALSL